MMGSGVRISLAAPIDFRQTIKKRGLSTALLAETNRQLDVLGLMVKHGPLVDATLIEAAAKRPP
jgi:transposase, IS5 family